MEQDPEKAYQFALQANQQDEIYKEVTNFLYSKFYGKCKEDDHLPLLLQNCQALIDSDMRQV